MSDSTDTHTDDFDEYARDYGSVLDESLSVTGAGRDFFAWNRAQWVKRLETRADRRPARILDLGCGDGTTEIYLKEAFPDATFCGIDVSAESIAVAKERGLSGCEYREYDGHALPFADSEFDLVFMAGVLHHIPADEHRHRLIGEMRRVLRPGSPGYVFEQNPVNPVTRRIVDRCPFDRHARLLPASELGELMRGARLAGPETHYIHFAPRHRLFAPVHVIEPWLRRIPLGAQYFMVGTRL